MAAKLLVDELLRLACIYAERDQFEYLRAISRSGDEKEIADTKAFIRQLVAYRKKRWGKTKLEEVIESGTPTPITEIAKRFNKIE